MSSNKFLKWGLALVIILNTMNMSAQDNVRKEQAEKARAAFSEMKNINK